MRILKRMLDFIASRMLMVTVACALLIISFYLAMNTANIWVLIDDGLDARASVVLMGEDAGKLTSYFRPEFIAQDPVLQVGMSDTSPYRDYEIRGYDHRVKMVSVWSWPWENVRAPRWSKAYRPLTARFAPPSGRRRWPRAARSGFPRPRGRRRATA